MNQFPPEVQRVVNLGTFYDNIWARGYSNAKVDDMLKKPKYGYIYPVRWYWQTGQQASGTCYMPSQISAKSVQRHGGTLEYIWAWGAQPQASGNGPRLK